jgi:hypothetical protein
MLVVMNAMLATTMFMIMSVYTADVTMFVRMEMGVFVGMRIS